MVRSYFLMLANYNLWATERLFDGLDDVSEYDYRRDVGLFFKSIHGTLNHLIVGEHMLWFRRFNEGISPKVALDSEVYYERSDVSNALVGGAKSWSKAILEWPSECWVGSLQYTTMRGFPASLPFAATLGHVFNHATHHRGQVSAAMTHLGYKCPELDMVYFLQSQQPTQS